jgi:SPP1 gp7 family putative phage head morphogenesis protein
VGKGNRAPADPDQFEEASKWFRGRVVVTRAEWDAMSRQARRQAFTIAGTQQAKVVQTVFDAIALAIDKGTPIDKWRKELRKKLGAFADKNSATLTTAFINANQTAYNTGRYYQMSNPAVTVALPYRVYDSVLDTRTTDICKGLNGTVLLHSDPWWLTHWPPMHHRCRSSVRALSASMAKKRGLTQKLPRPEIPDDFGLAPPLRAGQVWEPSAADFDPAAWAIYQRNQSRMKAANDNATKPKRSPRKD